MNINKYSISDIARQAGVSTTTISRVINNISEGVSKETRERVLRLIREMNYRPSKLARGVATSRSRVIGLIIPDITNLFYPQTVRGVDDYISSHGYSMLLYNSNSDPEREKQQLLTMVDNRTDGVILCSGITNEAFLRDYRVHGMPLVLIGRTFDSEMSDGCVTGNNEKGMYASTQYMLGHGHQRILYIDGDPRVAGTRSRSRGYRHALMDAGLPCDPELMYNGEFSIQYGYSAMSGVIERGVQFTAVVSGSDLVAIGAIKAMRKNGISIPDDVEIIGFDNISLCEIFEPQLSTISKPHYAMASEAARILLSVIDGTPPPINHIVVDTTLVLRETTRPDK